MNSQIPLKALLAFDVAMQTKSFSLAAEQLFVTPGAVGQQIRKLEEWLGVTLFIRRVRQVEPTTEALGYWAQIQPALAQIHQASQRLRDSQRDSVRLSMPPSLAATWFSRRMAGFVAAEPTITLHLSASLALVDFQRDAIDLAVRYYDGSDPALHSELLFHDEIGLYCSPDYVERLALKQPNDLQRVTLLRVTQHAYWDDWLAAFADLPAEQIDAIPSIHFDQQILALEAAQRGQGVVLSSRLLVEDALGGGRLLQPFPGQLRLPRAYYLVHPRSSVLSPAVQRFRDWLIDVAHQGDASSLEIEPDTDRL